MLPLRAAAEEPEAGRKARTLSRLLRDGLPVLDGVVLLPGEPPSAIAEWAAARGPFAVRSSSPLEDLDGASAAGLYESVTGVVERDLPAAIARVRASADTPTVVAYLAGHDERARPIAVLVQPDVGAVPLGAARSAEGGFLVEERAPRTPEWAIATAARLADGDALAPLLRRVERLLGGPVDVEYARAAAGPVLLQARRASRAPVAAAGALPPGRWRLDAEHNPDPLSRAQADLVALVDAPRFGARARVIGGYLYVREDLPPPSEPGSSPAAYASGLEAELRGELARADAAELPVALATYLRVVRRYAAEVRPRLGAAHRAVAAILVRELGEARIDPASLIGGAGGATLERDAALFAVGRAWDADRVRTYLERFGAYAAAWDVASPCDDEDLDRLRALATRRARGVDPARLRHAASTAAGAARAALARRLPPAAAAELEAACAILRDRTELAENDDLVFFEAQRLVRRALLARGRALADAGSLPAPASVFDLPLGRPAADPSALAEEAARAAADRHRAATRVPPYRIADRSPRTRVPRSAEVLHGRGLGTHARGRAYVVATLAGSVADAPDGAILVMPAALPSLAPHLPRLAGLVTEHGGALSHAATLAREVGLTAVLGAAGALAIPQGTPLYLDGERGRVVLLRDD